MFWTDERNSRLRELVRGMTGRSAADWKRVGDALGTSGKACGVQWSRIEKDGLGAVSGDNLQKNIDKESPLHVKRLHVSVPRETVSASGGMLTAVLYGDTHIPFHDQRSLDVVAQVIRIARPNVIAHQGDLLDCYHLSRFDKNPKRIHRLQDEIDAARQHLAAFRLLAPEARFIYLSGNHEDRLRRTLWSFHLTPRR